MEDILELYTTPPTPGTAVVCFDETPRQLIGEARMPMPTEPGRRARFDYEYRRNGTANIFMFLDAHTSWRHAKVTERRANIDFAECMRDLVDKHYPQTDQIKVVLDNLSTHGAAALYESFPPEEARRILRRLEFHYTPKHASWLNMVEIGVLVSQCLDRRIPDLKKLISELPPPHSHLGGKSRVNPTAPPKTGGPPHPDLPLRSADSAEEREIGSGPTFQNPCDEVLRQPP